MTDTSLKAEHVRNCWTDRELTFGRTLSVVLVQIVLWTLTRLFALWIVPHLPGFFLTGWRFSFTVFATAVVQCLRVVHGASVRVASLASHCAHCFVRN